MHPRLPPKSTTCTRPASSCAASMSPPPPSEGGATKLHVAPRSDDVQSCAGPRSVDHRMPSRLICRLGSPADDRPTPWTLTNSLNANPLGVIGIAGGAIVGFGAVGAVGSHADATP